MRGVNRVRLYTRRAIGKLRRTRDDNFIGFDKYQEQGAYHWRELQENEEYREKLRVIERFLKPGGTSLDLGCGDGVFLYAIAPQVRFAVGIDADFHAIRLAKRELATRGVQNAKPVLLPLTLATGDRTVASGAPYDVVHSMDVIEHLPSPEQLVDVAADLLADDGTAVIGTPLYIRDDLVSKYHVKEFTREEMRALMTARFELEEEVILPSTRSDGIRYEEGFYVGVGRRRR